MYHSDDDDEKQLRRQPPNHVDGFHASLHFAYRPKKRNSDMVIQIGSIINPTTYRQSTVMNMMMVKQSY